MSKKSEEIKTSKAGIIAHIIGAIAFIAVGVYMLTLDVDMIAEIAYSSSILAGGALLVLFGAYYMVKYFFNHEYAKVSNYGFTMGVILVIIGSAFIFKANLIAAYVDVLVCLLGVILGAIMIQQTFALFYIQRGTWFITLLFGAGTIAASIYFLMHGATFFNGILICTIYLIAVGGVSLFSLLLMAIGLGDHKRDTKRNIKRNMEDAPSDSKDSLDDSIFEDEPMVQIVDIDDDEPQPGSDSLFEE